MASQVLGLTYDLDKSIEDNIKEALGILAGYVSLCWDPKPQGSFQSHLASDAVDEVIDYIRGFVDVLDPDEIIRVQKMGGDSG